MTGWGLWHHRRPLDGLDSVLHEQALNLEFRTRSRSLRYPQCLSQCLACCKWPIDIWMNEWNSIIVPFRLDAQSDGFTSTSPLKCFLFFRPPLSLGLDHHSHSAGEFRVSLLERHSVEGTCKWSPSIGCCSPISSVLQGQTALVPCPRRASIEENGKGRTLPWGSAPRMGVGWLWKEDRLFHPKVGPKLHAHPVS